MYLQLSEDVSYSKQFLRGYTDYKVVEETLLPANLKEYLSLLEFFLFLLLDVI